VACRSVSLPLSISLSLVFVFASFSECGAMSSTDVVATKGKPVAMVAAWPQGVLEIINDPVRTHGFHPWFSECPNDVNYYRLKVQSMDDANRLVSNLAAIKTESLDLQLLPDVGATDGEKEAATFSLGNQQILDEWYKRLPEIEPGVRQFGITRYEKAPIAQDPTLCLDIDHDGIDLEKLIVPVNVTVTTATAAAYREEHKASCEKIDRFIERHQLRQKQMQDLSRYVIAAMATAKTIEPGMTRSQLVYVFQDDGGDLRDQRQYALRDCPSIKVTVHFRCTGDAADWSHDTIVSISKPFIETPREQ
jgi:hypothetical protein